MGGIQRGICGIFWGSVRCCACSLQYIDLYQTEMFDEICINLYRK